MVRDGSLAPDRSALDDHPPAGRVRTGRPHVANRRLHPARRRRGASARAGGDIRAPCQRGLGQGHRVRVRARIEGIARALGMPARLHSMPFDDLPEGASPYGPDPRRHSGYVIERGRRELGFEPSALEDALAETLAWYRVAKP